jgi:asparagine synthase (glutamine-hydrolysing)
VNVKVDRAAGACGLEVRAPLLDTDVVNLACQLPPGQRLRHLTSKYVLKRAMRGRLPDAILDRKKQGFGVPVARWMKEDLRPALLDELAPDKLRREGWFDPAAVAALLDDHLSGRRDRRKALWTLFTFERWLGTWATG